MEQLRADPSLYPTAIDELLRSRVARLALPAHGHGGHRDRWRRDRARASASSCGSPREPRPRDVPGPDRLVLTRKRDEHAAFGRGGPHFCLGAHLARLEIAMLVEELVKRVDEVELAAPPRRLRSNFTNGLKRLPVRVVEAT